MVAESLFATVFPSRCRLCRTSLTNISRLPVCQPCLADMRPISGGLCSICGERLLSPYPLLSGPADLQCGWCQRLAPPFSKAVAYGSYDSGLRDLIHLLKYEQVRPAAVVLGKMLAHAIARLEVYGTGSRFTIVPVPLHSRKLRQRGFNQSELIAQEAAKVTPGNDRIKLEAGILRRRRETVSQTGLTRHQRGENIRGAFALLRPERIAGGNVVLVDDVFTTGTTVSECARVLLRAGARKIYVATVARTLKADATNENLVRRIEPSAKALKAAG